MEKTKEQIVEELKEKTKTYETLRAIQCLLLSVPLKELFKGMDVEYRKVQLRGKPCLINIM